MRRWHAFTLIELLFVVAIVAILAAIAVPNFMEAQTRSKLSRTRCDMAILNTAVRAYIAQHDAYPPNQRECLRLLRDFRRQYPSIPNPALYRVEMPPRGQAAAKADRYPFLRKTGWDLARLTTPVAWLSMSLPMDPFQPRYNGFFSRPVQEPEPFIYLDLYDVFHENPDTTSTKEHQGFVLLSYGPDNSLSLPNPVFGPFIEYDPTNGTVSGGDLLSTGR